MSNAIPTQVGKCLCGCGQNVRNERVHYRSGHDARHAGIIARRVYEERNPDLLNQLPSQALRDRAQRMVDALVERYRAPITEPREVQARVGDVIFRGEIKNGKFVYKDQRNRTHRVSRYSVV